VCLRARNRNCVCVCMAFRALVLCIGACVCACVREAVCNSVCVWPLMCWCFALVCACVRRDCGMYPLFISAHLQIRIPLPPSACTTHRYSHTHTSVSMYECVRVSVFVCVRTCVVVGGGITGIHPFLCKFREPNGKLRHGVSLSDTGNTVACGGVVVSTMAFNHMRIPCENLLDAGGSTVRAHTHTVIRTHCCAHILMHAHTNTH